ncbi:MAG: DNA-3-methyladenine glycosylase I [Thermodesulfobacteriota bacterium]|nr:DNA-3-methyladenine glycosylase I [Thermodesulfobacteriota bacterium]
MKNYKAIFDAVEKTLVAIGSRNVPSATIRERLDVFKTFEQKIFSDGDYYDLLVAIPFYAGMRADVVSSKLPTIRSHFPDYETVSGYTESKVNEILNDPRMIRHAGKISACINNARAVKAMVQKYGSFQKYIDSFSPRQSLDNLLRLRAVLMRSPFSHLGRVTSYHFLTDIGMPVLKPDRVIQRIFYRLGLIQSEKVTDKQLTETIFEGQAFAKATGHPIRYIDAVFVVYGQVSPESFGIREGICLAKRPRCEVCGIRSYCNYEPKTSR